MGAEDIFLRLLQPCAVGHEELVDLSLNFDVANINGSE